MIVLCVGMYRACSTWQYGVAGAILERHRDGQRLGFVDGDRFAATPGSPEGGAAWSILKAHDAHPGFAEVLEQGRARGIYAHRDLRDVALSWMHKTGATFDEIVERKFLELCLENDRFWRSQPGVLVQSYESLIADPERGVAEIAAHLGIGLAEGEAGEIAEATSQEANRRRAESLADRLRAEGVELDVENQTRYDPESLLHWNHIRDGRPGAWQEAFSPREVAALARICGPWLIENGYEPDDGWAFGFRAEIKPVPPEKAAEVPRVSYAQNAEDILLDRIFRGQTGTYLDIGANHPTHNNNTYFFYLRGWRGVNVEPVAEARALFEADRPEDLNLTLAVSDVEGEHPFYEIRNCSGLSSLSAEAAEEQRARGFEVIEHRMPTRTVAGLAEEFRLAPPDFVSIDVEGFEEKVLRGIPLDTWRPKVFVIEATRPMTNTLAHHAWEPILTGQGYLFAAFDGINRYYVREDLREVLPLLEYPVNSLDFHERADTVFYRDKCEMLHERFQVERAFYQEALNGMTFLRDQARADANQLASEGDSLRERLAAEEARAAEERERFEQERLRFEQERIVLEQATAELSAEVSRLEAERDDLRADCATWESEFTSRARLASAERAAREKLQAELDADRDRHAAERDRFARERLALESDAAGWAHERACRESQVIETQRQLRPYRLIDRMGVVGAIHRRARKLKRLIPS